ncbi:MAG: DUF2201 family putative metallopeptidase, partial [Planctomycetota bacterium]
HEAEHIVRLHSFRRGSRDPYRFNVAADYLINADLKAAKFKLPREEIIKLYCDPNRYSGDKWSTEAVYADLEPPEQDDADQGQGEGDGESGSGAEFGDMADDIKRPGGGAEEQAEAERKATQRIHKAAHQARQAGTVPAHLEKYLEELTQPKVDWRELLRRFVTATSQDDQTWARLNRRVRHRGYRMPSVHSEQVGELVFVVDTSGSCWDAIPQFVSEAAYVAGEMKPERMHVIWCDTQVQHHDEFDDPNDADAEALKNIHVGGGTDMRAAFKYIEEAGIEPECIVFLTDLETPFPDEPPQAPVMWVSVEDHEAPFGEVVHMDLRGG